jgi:hypothetical protein
VETYQGTSKVTGETNKDQNQINGQLKASHIFHQTLGVHNRKPNTRAQRVVEKLKSFDPVTQDKAGTSTCSRNQHTKITSYDFDWKNYLAVQLQDKDTIKKMRWSRMLDSRLNR